MSSFILDGVKTLAAKILPVVAAAALAFPASRKLADGSWRDRLNVTYEIAGQSLGATFFLLVGLLEAVMLVSILWPKTRVPAGLAMAGFFVGALVFNLGFRVDEASLPEDAAGLSTLIALDVSHLLIGLGVAALWRSEGQPAHLLVGPVPRPHSATTASVTTP